MFPLTHIYLSTSVMKRAGALLVLGSILPDIAWTSKQKVNPKKIHDDPLGFYRFVKAYDKDLLDVAIGFLLHSNERGADYYSHFYRGGYAMRKGKVISSDVARLIGKRKGKESLTLAHNFVEASLDLHTLDLYPQIHTVYKRALKEASLPNIAHCLSAYLNMDAKVIAKELVFFLELMGPDNLSSEEGIAGNVFVAFGKLLFGKKIDEKECLHILKKARELTRRNHKTFMDSTIEKMRVDFALPKLR